MAITIAAGAEPIPGYILVEPLGRGGFGEVWKAIAPGGIPKAIKFVTGSLEEADGHVPAAQELKSLNRVKDVHHSFILAMERVDIVQGRLMIVMELADRNMLHRLEECQSQGLVGIPRDELLGYMDETAEALDLMNGEFGVQHLDIKPANIFLVYNHVKVADFGLAKDLQGMTAALTSGLTPVYASPETFEGTVSRFSDQYSLAIVYQELLTGKRPIAGNNGRQLAMAHVMGQPDLSPLPPEDREIVGRALAKKPNDRFPSCGEFVIALRKAMLRRPAAATVRLALPTGLTGPPRQKADATPAAPAHPKDDKRERPKPRPERADDPTTTAELALAETTKEPRKPRKVEVPDSPVEERETPETPPPSKRRPAKPAAEERAEGGTSKKRRQETAAEEPVETEQCPHCQAKLLDPGAHAWCAQCGYCRDLEEKKQPTEKTISLPVIVGGLLVGLGVGAGAWFGGPWLRTHAGDLAEFQHTIPLLLGAVGLVAIIGFIAVRALRPKRKKRSKKRRSVKPPK
jgi:serine/threonine protein kinase